jgi:hypothetical protein
MLFYGLVFCMLAVCIYFLIKHFTSNNKRIKPLKELLSPAASPIQINCEEHGLAIYWIEPNRGKAKNLYISNRGKRISTVTGVYWLDEQRFIANHRSGLRVALFDLEHSTLPICTAEVPHLTDDISAFEVAPNTWHVLLSGCWDCAYCLFELKIEPTPTFHLIEIKEKTDHSFSHGCTYGENSEIWLAYSIGADPRIENGDNIWRLPKPWGARKICIDTKSQNTYLIANNNTPRRIFYTHSNLSIWHLDNKDCEWKLLREIAHAHGDSLDIYSGFIWTGNQANDTLLGISLDGKDDIEVKCNLSFPHGLAISSAGRIAITNYGNSAIRLLELEEIIKDASSHREEQA